jgi:hypothetical protein
MIDHLTNRQIVRHYDRTLSRTEFISVDEHLAVCAECRREVSAFAKGNEKLRSLQEEPEVVGNETSPIAGTDFVPSEDAIQQPIRNSSPRKRPRRLGSATSFNSPGVAFGLGALTMLIIVILVWLIARPNRSDTTQSQAMQSTTPSPTAGFPPDIGIQPNASPLSSPSPQVLMGLTDGANQVGIDDKGNLVGFESLSPAHREMVKVALLTQQVANLAALSGIGGQQDDLKRGPNQRAGFALLSPVGRIIMSTRPTLRWSKLDGASEYRVEIYGSNSDLFAASPPLKSNSWELPNGLNRGEIYSWQVTATKDGESVKAPVSPLPDAKFKTLDAKQAADLTATQKNFAGSHLPLGVLYAQFGLLEDAEREFDALAKANPQSDIARKLLSNVRDARKAGMK